MKTARSDIVLNGLIISGGNNLHLEAVEILFLRFMVGLARYEFTDKNATISADSDQKGPGRRSVRSCSGHWC